MKKLKFIHQSSGTHWVGDGFPVRSVFSYDRFGKELDPFLLLDYAAPHPFDPTTRRRGVGPHPHRGFETVTLSFQGEVEHRDSSGGGGKIGPGDVQWMTAASGLLHEEYHSEDFARSGGIFEMAQLWVNLPAKDKSAPPRYQSLLKQEIPVVDLPDGAGTVRVVAGEFDGHRGPAKTFTPINLWELSMTGGKFATLKVEDGHTAALLVLRGEVIIGGEQKAGEGALAVFEREGEEFLFQATSDTRLLLMSGKPIGEPIVGQGPFVMNSQMEILQAFRDFQAGAMGEL
ncbi:pirin family protein [Luteolibacter luteus]|uniref:Pirin family protein n=1 Tax=Luteolibacter luteus TaxID=2728835 RepID=A0A858REE8_9BACT|nr:pirin family protein [Luteolibacter luteus]QJE94991.1 pirin family protein [Luteolibacter luteus]